MNTQNKVYSQIVEAIRFANYNIFDYKRISLILLDNAVEYLLSLQVYLITGYYYEHFENITKEAKKFNIINEKDKPILEYCHKARNNVYHKFSEDKEITDCCVLILSEFLYNNIEKLLKIGFIERSDTLYRNQEKIFKIGNLKSYDDVLYNLNALNLNNIKPSEIFSQILLSELYELIDFKECSANEDWVRFNEIISNQYFWDVCYKKEKAKNNQIEFKIFESDFKKRWKNLNQINVDKYKLQAMKLKQLSTNDSFEKFINIKNKLSPFYLGMNYYIYEQEYQADLLSNK